MARKKGSGALGPTRSMRLPHALDTWLGERFTRHPEKSPSEVLVSLVHGGLRLRDGYMAVHRRELEHYVLSGDLNAYQTYVRCLLDTFGVAYVEHLERWLATDGIPPTDRPRPPSTIGEDAHFSDSV
jgi:hypothetical protein